MKQAEDGTTQITAVLHGVRLTLHSERNDFIAFARAYLAPLIDSTVEPDDTGVSPHIYVQMTWAAHAPASESSDDLEQQEGLIFAGLPGCGKSTTSLAFLDQPEWQIVSDNLLSRQC